MKRFLMTAAMLALVCSSQSLMAQKEEQKNELLDRSGAQAPEAVDSRKSGQSAESETTRSRDSKGRKRAGKAAAVDDVGVATSANTRRPQAVLGVHATASPTIGVYIISLDTFGPAGTAGLLAGDYVLTVDGQAISSPRELSGMVNSHLPGDTVRLGIWRNGERRELEVTLGGEIDSVYRDANYRASDQPDAWLGVLLGPTNDGNGVRVEQLLPDGPADRAGIRPGDILLKKDGERINSIGQLIRDIDAADPGDSVTLQIQRDDQTMTQKVVLGESPDLDLDFDFRASPDQSSDAGFESWSDFGDDVSPTHQFLLDQHRRLAEQNQRIERMLIDLRQEIRELRNELARKDRRASN